MEPSAVAPYSIDCLETPENEMNSQNLRAAILKNLRTATPTTEGATPAKSRPSQASDRRPRSVTLYG
jgi:hypothetical protein